MIQQKGIARHFAELEMKLQIAIQQRFAVACLAASRIPSTANCSGSQIGIAASRQPRSQPLERSPQSGRAAHILFAQMDDARASPRRFADKSLLRQNVDRLADGACATPNFAAHVPSTMRYPGLQTIRS